VTGNDALAISRKYNRVEVSKLLERSLDNSSQPRATGQCPGYRFHYYSLLLRSGIGAEYCDQPVCLCVCLSVSVCLSASISLEPLDQSAQFLQIPVAVARFSSGGVAIRYVLPVLWITSRLVVMYRTAMRRTVVDLVSRSIARRDGV